MLTLADLAARFPQPDLSYSPAVFWFLNGDLEPPELARQLRLMKAVGVGTVVLHARQGHTVGYLTQRWFDAIRFCVETCAELGLKAWLYDEDNWPSGYAGGEVLKRYPNARAKCLARVPAGEEAGDLVVARAGGEVFVRRLVPWHPAYSEGWYTDLMDRTATDTFLATTHQRYAEVLGGHLGTTVTAVFTDEPGFYNHFHSCAPGTVPWTDDLPEEFRRRTGYDLPAHLPELFSDGPGAARVRADFYRVVSRLILERYYLPLKEWCNAHGMQSVGHVNNEEYLVDHARYNADFFTAMDGLDFPGIDIIGPAGDWHRQPDSFINKLASSAAHVRGKTQVMSETYGAAGWDLSPEEMRRIADWQSVRGVTRLVFHAFYYSIEGPRYHECPPSLFFQSPHWPLIPGLVSYLTRWAWLLENTRPGAQVAVYYPIHAVRQVTSPQVPPSLPEGLDEEAAGEAGALSRAFRRITDGLFRRQVDFDVLDDAALAEASFAGGRLQVRDLSYACLVLPPGEPSEEAAEAIRRAREAGVPVLSGPVAEVLAAAQPWATAALEPASDQVTLTRRRAQGGDLFLVVNEGQDPYHGTLTFPVVGVVSHWDLAAGQVDPWGAESAPGETRISLDLLGGAAACFAVAET